MEAKLRSVQQAPAAGKAAAAEAAVHIATVADLVALADLLASEATGVNDGKPILEAVCKVALPKLKNDDCVAVCKTFVTKLESRKQFFAREVSIHRPLLT